jgi:hypothetical protein
MAAIFAHTSLTFELAPHWSHRKSRRRVKGKVIESLAAGPSFAVRQQCGRLGGTESRFDGDRVAQKAQPRKLCTRPIARKESVSEGTRRGASDRGSERPRKSLSSTSVEAHPANPSFCDWRSL